MDSEVLLPIADDLVKLTKKIRDVMTDELKRYTELVLHTVGGLILLNKRRPMKVAELNVTNYRCILAVR